MIVIYNRPVNNENADNNNTDSTNETYDPDNELLEDLEINISYI
jgi:hypothetical protein